MRLSVRSLYPDDSSRIFPLAQLVQPALTMAAWRSYVDRLCRAPDHPEERGLVAAEDRRGYFYGFFGYRLEHDLAYGRVFHVNTFVAPKLVGSVDAGECLLEEVYRLAEESACDAAHILLPGEPKIFDPACQGIMQAVQKAGLAADAIRVCRIFSENKPIPFDQSH